MLVLREAGLPARFRDSNKEVNYENQKAYQSWTVFCCSTVFVLNGQSPGHHHTPTTNPRVVVTDNLSKPATPATQTARPTTTTTKVGNFSINVTEGVTGQNLESGKYLTVTKWDGSKWVTKREWVPNGPVGTKPSPQ